MTAIRLESIFGESSVELNSVRETFAQWLYLPDTTVVDVAIATLIARRMGGDPVWVMVIGAPSCGKTEVLRSLYGLPEVHAVSSLTGQTFASGLRGKAGASLLHRMDQDGRSFLVLKDFTTVLTLHRDARQEILSQLREIYDGSFVKEFGTGDTVAWEGQIGLLAGVTPIVDNHRIVTALLGERFLYLRLPGQDRQKLSRRALEGRAQEYEMREALRDVVHGFVESVDTGPRDLSADMVDRIVMLSDLTTWVRSGVERDAWTTRDILTVPEPEAPARFAKEIAGLVAALLAMGHDEDSASQLVARIAADSMPPVRRAVLGALRSSPERSTPGVADDIGLPTTTTTRILEDLAALGILERLAGPGGPGGAHRWSLGVRAADLWDAVPEEPECHPKCRDSIEKPAPTSLNTSPSLPLEDLSEVIRQGGVP